MNRNSMQPLESYRLAQMAGQLCCYICGEANTYESEMCARCSAPLALAHQAQNQKLRPSMIGIIGAAGVGKTVYLGMLMDMLSRRKGQLQVVARGAFSISLQQTTVQSLVRCEFPGKTPNEPDRWNWVHCEIRAPRRKKPIDMIMPDMAGDALLQEVDHPFSYQVVRSFLSKCAGAIILLDSTKLRDGREQDYYAMKLVSYLTELDDHPKKGWPSRPVAFVLSKADECEECFQDPEEYAKTNAAGLWQHCKDRFKNFQFFASGVAGSCAYRESFTQGNIRVPLRIEPRGIIEPFDWLVGRVRL